MLNHHDGRIRFYLETICNEQGETIAQVMERPAPYKKAVCVETFTHEWKACKRIKELKQAAQNRGESVVWCPGWHQVGENPWMLEAEQ